jgi:hypothetical protein
MMFLFTGNGMLCATAIEATWTPNEDGDAPLPLSNNQRQQLLQLEDTIRSAPDPQATLMQVAQSNEMDPQELVNLLNQNRREMQAAGALQPPGTSGRNIWKLVSSMGVVLVQSASKHPRSFGLTTASLLLLLFVAYTAPRTGVVLSSSAGLLSKGATTVWNPPVPFVQSLLDSPRFSNRGLGIKARDAWKSLIPLETPDGLTWHKNIKKITGPHALRQAVTFQTTIDPDFVSYLQSPSEETDQGDVLGATLDLCMEHASTIVSTRQLTEFVPTTSAGLLRMITEQGGRERNSILVVRHLGDWGRYGLLPVQVTHEHSDENETVFLTLTTLKGAHWDGQIHLQIDRQDNQLIVRTSIVIPKSGRKVSKKLATKIVENLTLSVAASIRTRTKQSLARRSQSSRFQGKAHSRAQDRRHTRHNKETAIEEMAADRRRRWQRQNPNSGHYRPSGDRMRSPNNAVY